MSEPAKIGFDKLADWAEGRLPAGETREIEGLLARADDETRAEAAWLRAFARASEDTVISEPPADLREALLERFDDYAEERRRPNLLRRLAATLTFDGGLQPAFGLRSAGTRESRQLVYSTDAADIALNLFPRAGEDGLDVHGQILPLDDVDPSSFAVRLLDGGSEVALTATDDAGEFSFESVNPGVYELVASGDRVEIRAPGVELRPSS